MIINTGNVTVINCVNPRLDTIKLNTHTIVTIVLCESLGNKFVKKPAHADVNPTEVVKQASIITSPNKILPLVPYNSFTTFVKIRPPFSDTPSDVLVDPEICK